MNDRIKLKICGITNEAEIPIINKVRPDYIGFVFANSKRRVDEEQAMKLKSMLIAGIKTVGVFVDENPERIAELLNRNVIDIAQLHGHEDEEDIAYIKKMTGKPVIKAIILGGSTEVNDYYSTCVERWRRTQADYLLLDSGKGSGKTFDWSVIDREELYEAVGGIFLAGGINPDNVADAIRQINPYCIDVSSGVEKDGLKNDKLISELVNNMHYSR